MNRKIEQENLILKAILSMDSVDDLHDLFVDLCTVNEMISISQRFTVAKLLRDGLTYNDISEQTGASTATITRVNRCLQYGSGGYIKALSNIEKDG